jgi:hypothetical protein
MPRQVRPPDRVLIDTDALSQPGRPIGERRPLERDLDLLDVARLATSAWICAKGIPDSTALQ